MVIAAIDPFWGVVFTGTIGLVGLVLERRWRALERKNDEQHMRGYTLLQSIDQRTIAIDEKVDKHGEWIARHDLLHIWEDHGSTR